MLFIPTALRELIIAWRGLAAYLLTFVLVGGLCFGLSTGGEMLAYWRNPRLPARTDLSEIAQGNVDAGRWVEVGGVAHYELAHHTRIDSNYRVFYQHYYYLVDENSGQAVLVLSPADYLPVEAKPRQVRGILRPVPDNIRALMDVDRYRFKKEGGPSFNLDLYLVEGQAPPAPSQMRVYLLFMAGWLAALLLGLFPFLVSSDGIEFSRPKEFVDRKYR